MYATITLCLSVFFFLCHLSFWFELCILQPEGRPSNLSVQRSSGIQDRERDPKSSIFLSSPVVEKVPIHVGSSDGWEKTKMKGRRSATIKNDVLVPSGPTDGEREHKGIAQNHRLSVEGRSRPSEGHGFRSVLGSGHWCIVVLSCYIIYLIYCGIRFSVPHIYCGSHQY